MRTLTIVAAVMIATVFGKWGLVVLTGVAFGAMEPRFERWGKTIIERVQH